MLDSATAGRSWPSSNSSCSASTRQACAMRDCLAAGLLAVTFSLPASPAASQSLNEALAGAYQTNPVLQAARATLRATDELVPEALSGWRPTITGQVAGGGGIDNKHTGG